MSHRILRDLFLGATTVKPLDAGTVISPGSDCGCYFELPTGTYTIANGQPPQFFFAKCTSGTATITGVGALASGEIGLFIADSTSSWSGHVFALAGDDALTQVLAALGGSASLLPIEDAGGLITATNVGTRSTTRPLPHRR
jgi:hypothetical protein